jgi:hypothetical protein
MQLSHAKLVPGPAVQGSLRGVALVIPRGAGAQQSLRGGGLEGRGSQRGMDPAQPKRRGSRWGVVVPRRARTQQCLRGGSLGAVPEVWIRGGPRGRGPGGPWIWHRVRAQHGLRGGDPGGGGAWIQCGAVAWHSRRGREPGGVEQQLCRLMGWGVGRQAVLLLDHGMEKPSRI